MAIDRCGLTGSGVTERRLVEIVTGMTTNFEARLDATLDARLKNIIGRRTSDNCDAQAAEASFGGDG